MIFNWHKQQLIFTLISAGISRRHHKIMAVKDGEKHCFKKEPTLVFRALLYGYEGSKQFVCKKSTNITKSKSNYPLKLWPTKFNEWILTTKFLPE